MADTDTTKGAAVPATTPAASSAPGGTSDAAGAAGTPGPTDEELKAIEAEAEAKAEEEAEAAKAEAEAKAEEEAEAAKAEAEAKAEEEAEAAKAEAEAKAEEEAEAAKAEAEAKVGGVLHEVEEVVKHPWVAARKFSGYIGTQLVDFAEGTIIDPEHGPGLAARGAPVRPAPPPDEG